VKGCQKDDVYAMGKTLFELLFGQDGNGTSSKVAITIEEVTNQNFMFRSLLENSDSVKFSRFALSEEERLLLLEVIRGLCKTTNPITFRDAELILRNGMEKIQYQ
jgi:hypothetical protein